MADIHNPAYIADQQGSHVGLKRIALGALALYALNFGGVALLFVITPFALVIGGVLAEHFGAISLPNPLSETTVVITIVLTTLACLISIAIIGYVFYWGVRSILRKKVVSSSIFLIGLMLLHAAEVTFFGFHIQPVNWFGAAMAAWCIAVLAVRRDKPH